MTETESSGGFKELVGLKRGEGILMLKVKLVEDNSNEDIPFRAEIEVNRLMQPLVMEVFDELCEYTAEITDNLMCSLKKDKNFAKELEMSMRACHGSYTISSLSLGMGDNGLVMFAQVEVYNEANAPTGEAIRQKPSSILEKMTKRLNELYCEFLELEDEGKLYKPKEFRFICSRTENGEFKWNPYDFIRMTDRPISQQKVEIAGLIERGVDKKVLAFINKNDAVPNEAKLVVVKFISDGFTYYQMGFGV